MSLDFYKDYSTWTDELFGVKKPIIAMCHLQPLPGDPYYDEEGGLEKVVNAARKDVIALQNGGVDGIMFSNEYSLPYLTKIEPITVGTMAYVIGRLKDEIIKIPYGVNCLWDPIASLDLAKAVDGKFIREIISGVYASDFGTWGKDPFDAVHNSVVLDTLANMALKTIDINKGVTSMQKELLDKHFLRKHGAGAYYGQG